MSFCDVMLSTCVFTRGARPICPSACQPHTHFIQFKVLGIQQHVVDFKANKLLILLGRQQCESIIAHLNKELSAFDVSNEWYGVVNGHSTSAVTFGHKGGQASSTRVPHGQIDDQVKMVLL